MAEDCTWAQKHNHRDLIDGLASHGHSIIEARELLHGKSERQVDYQPSNAD